jgi:hypothetical protein
MDGVMDAVEQVCREQQGNPVESMAKALVEAFLTAKMKDGKTSVALYAVSADVDGARIVREISLRSNQAIIAMLASAREPLTKDPQLVASMLQGAMSGISRRLLESDDPGKYFEAFRQELTLFACSYLKACSRGL